MRRDIDNRLTRLEGRAAQRPPAEFGCLYRQFESPGDYVRWCAEMGLPMPSGISMSSGGTIRDGFVVIGPGPIEMDVRQVEEKLFESGSW